MTAYSVGTGDFVAVQTVDVNTTTKYLTILRPGQPLTGKVYFDHQLDSTAPFISLVGLSTNAVEEFDKKMGNLQAYNTYLPRFYYKPRLIARATVDDKYFKQSFSLTLNVTSPTYNYSGSKNVSFYNVKSKIETSSKAPDKIQFPNNANS